MYHDSFNISTESSLILSIARHALFHHLFIYQLNYIKWHTQCWIKWTCISQYCISTSVIRPSTGIQWSIQCNICRLISLFLSDMSLCDLCSRYSYNMIRCNIYQRNGMISLHLTACSLITHPHCTASEFKHFRNNNWKNCCQKCCLSMINICCCEREGWRVKARVM